MALVAMVLRTLTGEEAPAKDADDAGPLRPSDVGVLRVCFDSIDADRSGSLSRSEFTPWCLRLGLAPSADAAARAFRDVATAGGDAAAPHNEFFRAVARELAGEREGAAADLAKLPESMDWMVDRSVR